VYQADRGQFERIELSADEFQFRLARLVEVLTRLQLQKDEHEQRDIINRGNFYYAGHRYEYNTQIRTFQRIELTESEYRERVRRLLEQLLQIGYGTMNEAQCRVTIDTGVFYYGGYEWVYNHRSGLYEMGARSDKEPGIADIPSTSDYDSTKYDSTKRDNGTTTVAATTNVNRRPKPELISENRGDQPPQTFAEDYEESEELIGEPEPGITPVQRPRPPSPTRPSLPPPPPPPPPPVTAAVYPGGNEEEHSRYEHKRTENVVSVAVPVPTQQTEYKKSYHHRKETVYTQTGGAVPIQFEPQLGTYTVDGSVNHRSGLVRQPN